MGFIDDAKETLNTAGEKARHEFEEAKDRLGDKADEVKADADVKRAEAERDSVHKRNDIKEDIRD
jgi:vacuolar-type H+-ATPase subunit H